MKKNFLLMTLESTLSQEGEAKALCGSWSFAASNGLISVLCRDMPSVLGDVPSP